MTPWKEWLGGPQPVADRRPVAYRLRDGYADAARAGDLHWAWVLDAEFSGHTVEDDIVAYMELDEREYSDWLEIRGRLHPVHKMLRRIAKAFRS